jgi:protein-glutamine gamma-glutamyltransferase
LTATLRLFLIALVAVNLAFVHATESASADWLVPMLALTIGSPLLVRFRDSIIYRLLWNGVVLGLFALLVQHATSSAAMEYLLEDGLRLAAICQVHLLNNMGARQRPDLLFFNSFLIALVTAFLTWDVMYSAIFLAYVPVLIIGLQVYCLAPPGSPKPPGELLRRVIGDGLRRSAVALALTGSVFFVWPRDFTRRGLVGERFEFAGARSEMEIGFSEEVQLDRKGQAGVSDEVVLRARLLRGHPDDVSPYFRGATLLHFDGSKWDPGPPRAWDPRWIARRPGLWTRLPEAPGPALRCELEDGRATRLFSPLETRSFQLLEPNDAAIASGERDGTVRHIARTDDRVVYRLDMVAGAGKPGGETEAPRTRHDMIATRVVPGTAPPALLRLAGELADGLPEHAPQHVLVERFRSHLEETLTYLAPGADGAAASLDGFIRGNAGAHCEFFATALAMMLRSRGVPCRLVTGYASDEWDTKGQVLTVRRLHAHAWIEVLDPEAGWMTVDATPALTAGMGADGPGLIRSAQLALSRFWDRVVGFDEDARARAYAWLADLPDRLTIWVGGNPHQALLALFGIPSLLVLLARLRRPKIEPAIADYHSCLRKLRLTQEPGETPRDTLERARATGLPADRVERLATATSAHERARYATPARP